MYNPMPVNYMDPYFIQLMRQYGNVPSMMGQVPALNMNSVQHMHHDSTNFLTNARNRVKSNKTRQKKPILKAEEMYDSCDPKNQRFMKIKEYLDDRESEFVNSGSRLKAFDSNTSQTNRNLFSSDIKSFDLKSISPDVIRESFKNAAGANESIFKTHQASTESNHENRHQAHT